MSKNENVLMRCDDVSNRPQKGLVKNKNGFTYDEWWSVITRRGLSFGVWREDHVDYPETRRVVKPQQENGQKHRTQMSYGGHVSRLAATSPPLVGRPLEAGGGDSVVWAASSETVGG